MKPTDLFEDFEIELVKIHCHHALVELGILQVQIDIESAPGTGQTNIEYKNGSALAGSKSIGWEYKDPMKYWKSVRRVLYSILKDAQKATERRDDDSP